jgi:hypothetical protein
MPLIITAAISFHFKLRPLVRRASFLSSGRLSLHESTREFSHARFNHGIQRARSLAYYATEDQNTGGVRTGIAMHAGQRYLNMA